MMTEPSRARKEGQEVRILPLKSEEGLPVKTVVVMTRIAELYRSITFLRKIARRAAAHHLPPLPHHLKASSPPLVKTAGCQLHDQQEKTVNKRRDKSGGAMKRGEDITSLRSGHQGKPLAIRGNGKKAPRSTALAAVSRVKGKDGIAEKEHAIHRAIRKSTL